MIYLNNAGTSWPKPAPVAEAVARAALADPGEWAALLESSRAQVAAFFGVGDPELLLLTAGCTTSLAVAIADVAWRAGDVAVTSSLEHHALLRPLLKLERLGTLALEAAPRAADGPLDLEWVERRLRAGRVRLVAASAASNVTGERLPVAELVRLAHEHGALCLVDAAQLAGVEALDFTALGADLVTFAGHKAPLGPQGIGGLYVAAGVDLESPAASCDLRRGGEAPQACSPRPSWCDGGSANLAGAAGLAAGVGWIRERGHAALREATRALTERLLEGLAELPAVTVHGAAGVARSPIVSITCAKLSPGDLERRLLAEHGIATRGGHHCAPQAHEALGTAAQGTLRLSFGPGNREDDADAALAALGAVTGAS